MRIKVLTICLLVVTGCALQPVKIEVSRIGIVEFSGVEDIYQGVSIHEVIARVAVGEPTQITFPTKIWAGYKKKDSNISIDRRGAYIVVFASAELPPEGEAILIILENGTSFPIRLKPADSKHPRDAILEILSRKMMNNIENSVMPGCETEGGNI